MHDSIQKKINLAAPIDRVWSALTDFEQFGTWFRAEISGPFVVGAVLRGVATSQEQECVAWTLEVTKLEPEHLFAFTWQDEVGPAQRETEPATSVTFRLDPISTGTRLVIAETGFAALSDKNRIDMFKENTNGWNEQAQNLAAYVEA